jgi:hypothetical protein
MYKQKTVTVSDHERFRRSISDPAPPPPIFDEIDEYVAADPILDHPPAKKGRSEIDRLMDILDQLAVDGGSK